MLSWRPSTFVKISNEKITKTSHSIKRKDLRKLSGDPFFLCFLSHPPLASIAKRKRNENPGFVCQLSNKKDSKFMKRGAVFIENDYYFSTLCLA